MTLPVSILMEVVALGRNYLSSLRLNYNDKMYMSSLTSYILGFLLFVMQRLIGWFVLRLVICRISESVMPCWAKLSLICLAFASLVSKGKVGRSDAPYYLLSVGLGFYFGPLQLKGRF